MTLTIEKLSERNLQQVLEVLFPQSTIVAQKRFKSEYQIFVVDYYFEAGGKKFVVEFDGPTHFTNTKTQFKDIELADYCNNSKIRLIKIPYFMQLDNHSIYTFFTEDEHQEFNLIQLINTIDCKYNSGFNKEKNIFPGDYNIYGWELFWKFYVNTDGFEVKQQIYFSLEGIDETLTMGIGWEDHPEKSIFINEFPT